MYLMSQNRVVQEKKRDSVFSRHIFLPLFIKDSRYIETVSKNTNGANMFRISSGSALLGLTYEEQN